MSSLRSLIYGCAFIVAVLLQQACSNGTEATDSGPVAVPAPSQFKQFSASASTSGKIILVWQIVDNSKVKKIVICRDDINYLNKAQCATNQQIYSSTNLTRTSYEDSNLSPNHYYYYSIFAVNDSDDLIMASTAFALSFDANVIADVTNVVHSSSDHAINLKWTNPSIANLDRIVIRRSKSPATAPASPSDGNEVYNAMGEVYTDNNLVNGQTYHYTIFSRNSAGDYSPGVIVSDYPRDNVAPAAVTNFRVINPTNTSLALAWTLPSDADFASVKIYRSQVPVDIGSENGTVVYQGNGNTFVNSGLATGSTYYYTIFALDTSGNRSLPQSLSEQVVGDITPPTIVSVSPAFAALAPILNPQILANFSEAIDSASLDSNILLVDANTNAVPGKIDFNPASPNLVGFVPDNGMLALNTSYTVTVLSNVKDLSGNTLQADQSWTFSTVDGEWQAQPKLLSNLAKTSAPQLTPFTPSLASNDQTTIVVWRESGDVYARFFNEVGGWDTLPTKLNTFATGAMEPQVVMDNSGDVFVVWTQNNAGVQNLYAIRHSATNGWDSQPEPLQDPATVSQPASGATLAMDDSGSVIVAWLQRDSSLSNNVWARRLVKAAAWSASSALLMENDSGTAETTAVAMDAVGNAVVVWNQRLSTANAMLDLMYQRYDQQLGAWSGSAQGPIDGDPLNDSTKVKISEAGNGLFFVAWAEANDVVGVRQYNFSSDSWNATQTIDPDKTANSEINPALASNRSGDAVLLWSDGPGLYVNVFTPASGWRGYNKLSGENSVETALSMDSQGNALLLWRSATAVKAYRYKANQAWNSANIMTFYEDPNHSPGSAALAADKYGKGVAAWSYESDDMSGGKEYLTFAKQFRFQDAGPDLSVKLDNVTATANGSGSNDVVVSYTVSNLGNAASGAFSVDIWSGNNAFPVAGQRGNQTVPVAGLAAQQSLSFNTTVPLSSPTGIALVVVDAGGDISERNEEDNVSKPRRWSLPANLSVTVDNVAVSSVSNGNVNLALNYTVTNSGYSPSGNFSVDFWADSATVPSALTNSLKQISLPSLQPGQSLSNVVNLTTSTLFGSAYAFVNKSATVVEINSSDNVSPPLVWQAPANLTLSISNVSVGAASGGANNSLAIDFVVINNGAQPSGNFTVAVWADSNKIPAPGDIPDLQLNIPSLAAGQTTSVQTAIVSTALGSGSAYLLLDNTNSVVEFNKQDNLSNVISWQMPANLAVTIDNISATAATSGNNVAITYTVRNTGVASSGAFAVDFWSNLATAPVMGNVGEASISSTGLMGGQSITGVVVIASALNTGSAYAIVDTSNAVSESNELDNISAASIWQFVAANPPANLIVSIDSVSTSPNSGGGSNINITYSVTNLGGLPSGNFNVELWAHSASAPALNATGQVTVPEASLAASASVTKTISIVSTLGSGSAYALVDAGNLVVESNELDNLSQAFNWQLAANLIISVNSVGVTAVNGSNDISVNYTVTNSGISASGAFNVDLWSDSATAPVVGAIGELSEAHVSLATGVSESRTVILHNPAASGTVFAVVDSRQKVVESNEADNVSGGNAWSAALPPPNLTVAINSISASPATAGSNVSLTYTVTNNGGDVSGNFQVDLWDNLAAAPTLTQLSSNNFQHVSLVAGQSVTNTVTLASTLNLGTAYVTVDAPGVVAESNENDNVSPGMSWQLPANLVATINAVSAVPGTAGNDVTINYTVTNVGAQDSGAFAVGLWSNAVSAPSLGNTPDASSNLASLAAGASVTNALTLQNSAGSGTAYVIVDIGNVVAESNELDNLIGKSWQLPANLSLAIDAVSAIPGTTTNSVSVTFTVTNSGVANSGAFAVDLWSNSSTAPLVGDIGDVRESFTGLAGASSVTRTTVLSSALVSGNAYAVVDTLRQVNESNEADNVSSAASWKFPANLGVHIDSVSAVANGANNLVTINYTITNSGDSDAGAFNVDFWVDAATAPTLNGVGDITISKLGLAAKQTISASVSLQTSLGGGTAYAYADTQNLVVESIESDNASNGASWQLPANLVAVIDSINANSKDNIIINYTVNNQGVAASGNYTSALWVNSASAPTAGATGFDSSEALISLNGGGSDVRSVTLPTTRSSGVAYVSVDHGQVVSESNEGDNIVALAWQRPANLTVSITAVNVTKTATGNDLAISYTVQNTGGTAAAQFELGFWSDSATVPVIGTSVAQSTALYAGLAAGGVISDTVTLASTAASGTAYVAVDNSSVIVEFDENDNVSTGVAWTEPVVAQPPNLSVVINSITEAVAVSGGFDITINYTVSNTGLGQSGGFTVDLWSNALTAPAVGAAGEVQVSHANLLAQTSITGSVVINTPYTSGNAYAVVDSGNLVVESNETDNVSLISTWTVPAGTLPNITVTLDSVSAVATATAGVFDVTLTYTVTNAGIDPSGDFSVALWSDSLVVPDQSTLAETTLLQTSLAGSASATRTVTLQNSVSAGTAYIYADFTNVVTEFNEGDNATAGDVWTVSAVSQPDLSVSISSVSAVPAVTGGSDVTINYSVTNNDVVASGNFSLGLWSSAATAPVVGDVSEATVNLTSLAGGASISQSITLNNALTNGTAYAIVDPTNAIVESNETNNRSAGIAWVSSNVITFDFEDGLFPALFTTPTTATGAWSADATSSGPSIPGGTTSFISPLITANQSTCFNVTLNNVQNIQFDVRTDSEAGFDFVYFFIDEPNPDATNYISRWSGNIAWQTWSSASLATPLLKGAHTFEWCYNKDASASVGADRAWVDNIIID